jgi:hypothetical protein
METSETALVPQTKIGSQKQYHKPVGKVEIILPLKRCRDGGLHHISV